LAQKITRTELNPQKPKLRKLGKLYENIKITRTYCVPVPHEAEEKKVQNNPALDFLFLSSLSGKQSKPPPGPSASMLLQESHGSWVPSASAVPSGGGGRVFKAFFFL